MSTNPSLTHQPAADQNLSWLDGLDPSLADSAFAQAEVNASIAQQDFAATRDKHGARVALADFNRRVLRWAQEFTNPRLARVMYVLAKSVDGTTHSYAISVNGKIAEGTKGHRDIAPDKLLDRYRTTYAKQGHTISYAQFWRYLKQAERLGLITRTKQEGRQGESGEHPGAWLPTITHVNFWRVLKDGKLMPHDFLAPLPGPPGDQPEQPPAKSDMGLDTGADTGSDTQSLVSRENSCSSLGQVKAKKKDVLSHEGKSRPAASKEATESGSCLRCSKPAAWSIPGNDGQPIFRCDSCISKLPAFAKNLYSPDQDAQVRQLETSAKRGEVENDYWVYRDRRFYKQSQHDPQGSRNEVRLVHLTKSEGIYLWKTLKPHGQFPNSFQRNFMAHKAFGDKLPPMQPKPSVSKSRQRQEQLRRQMDRGW